MYLNVLLDCSSIIEMLYIKESSLPVSYVAYYFKEKENSSDYESNYEIKIL